MGNSLGIEKEEKLVFYLSFTIKMKKSDVLFYYLVGICLMHFIPFYSLFFKSIEK